MFLHDKFTDYLREEKHWSVEADNQTITRFSENEEELLHEYILELHKENIGYTIKRTTISVTLIGQTWKPYQPIFKIEKEK